MSPNQKNKPETPGKSAQAPGQVKKQPEEVVSPPGYSPQMVMSQNMILENIVANGLTLEPVESATHKDWRVGSQSTGFYAGESPEEALRAWAADYAPQMFDGLPPTDAPDAAPLV